MMDFIKIAGCLSCVGAVVLTPLSIVFHRNISSENWFLSKKRMIWAASPFALISLYGVVIMEMMKSSTTLSASIQQPNMMFVEADDVLSTRFTLLCAYITFLMSLVTLKTGWSSEERGKIILTRPFLASLLAIDILFLQALWEWICNTQPGQHPFTKWAYCCMLASWLLALGDMTTEQEIQQMIETEPEIQQMIELKKKFLIFFDRRMTQGKKAYLVPLINEYCQLTGKSLDSVMGMGEEQV